MDKVHVTKTREKNGIKTSHAKTTEDFADLTGEMKNQVKTVVIGLVLGDRKFLLAIAWVTKESKLMHMKFPWLLGADKTFQTNAKKGPLA